MTIFGKEKVAIYIDGSNTYNKRFVSRLLKEAPKLNQCYSVLMKGPDLDRERSERKHSLVEFLTLYNKGLPFGFPRATRVLLAEYQNRYAGQFKDGLWSLDLHRKKLMDWLPAYLKSLKS